jgi:hypothetical protein
VTVGSQYAKHFIRLNYESQHGDGETNHGA